MQVTLSETKNTARLAGFLYLLFGITSYYGLMYFPSPKLGGEVFPTGESILNNESIFRLKIATNLISSVLFVFLALVLHKLFNQVGVLLTKLLVYFIIVQIPIVFILESFHLTALLLLKGEILPSLSPIDANDLAMLLMQVFNRGITLLEMFYGLWLLPFGALVYKSGFLPKLLGVFLTTGGAVYLVEWFVALVFPQHSGILTIVAPIFFALAELSTILWLLIVGAQVKET
jgi:hypothetical protein